ncbi:hypothetical protein Tco_1267802 [Tanacetum coccineum]
MEEDRSMNVIEVTKLVDLNKQVFEDNNEFESDTENVIPEVADPNAVIEEVTECMKTPRETLYEHNKTPGGSIYLEPRVQGIPILVKGTYYDTVDEAVDMYTKYAEMGGFEVKKSGQSMKGQYEYVHGTTNDFKNHQRDVNVFIGESDAQMLINKMENRKMYVPNFTFQYKVENSELVAMFWANEVAKCNYKEFGDIIYFDATFNSNK